MHICALTLGSAPQGEGVQRHNLELTGSAGVSHRRPPASISPCFQSEVFTPVRHFALK
ncbi:hypothetical protein V1289_006935 [Bradyrhizobium sp. AZCC 2289]